MEIILKDDTINKSHKEREAQIFFSIPNSALYTRRNSPTYVIREFEKICSEVIMNNFYIATTGGTLVKGFEIGKERTIITLNVSVYCDMKVLDRIKMINSKSLDMRFAYGMALLHSSPLSVLLKRNEEVFLNGMLLVDVDTTSEYIIRRQNDIDEKLLQLHENHITCPSMIAMTSIGRSIMNQILDEFDISSVYSDDHITIYRGTPLVIDPVQSYQRVIDNKLPITSFTGKWASALVDIAEMESLIGLLLPDSFCRVTFDGTIYCEVCCLNDLSLLNLELEKYVITKNRHIEYIIPEPIRSLPSDMAYYKWGNYMRSKLEMGR